MASRPIKPSAVYKEEKERTRSKVIYFITIAFGLIIVFFLAILVYLSPFFDSFRASQATTAAQTEAEPVTPIKDPTAPIEYEFYEVLPEQDFQSSTEGLSVQEAPTTQATVRSPDTIVTAKPTKDEDNKDKGDEDKAADTVNITEESTTYDEPASDTAKADTKATGTTYILQIRSYTTADEADIKRAEVLMAGVDAVVVKRTDSTKGTHFYQVVSTPMNSKEEASQASARLSSNGIDSLIVEQKR